MGWRPCDIFGHFFGGEEGSFFVGDLGWREGVCQQKSVVPSVVPWERNWGEGGGEEGGGRRRGGRGEAWNGMWVY
jgi:hypothetical protein